MLYVYVIPRASAIARSPVESTTPSFFHLIVNQVSQSPFSLELFLQIRQLSNQRVASVCESLLWRVVVFGLDSKHKVGKQRMFHLVGCKDDPRVVQQL